MCVIIDGVINGIIDCWTYSTIQSIGGISRTPKSIKELFKEPQKANEKPTWKAASVSCGERKAAAAAALLASIRSADAGGAAVY